MRGAQQVVEFLERNVIGHTVVARPISTRSGDERYESRYFDQTFYSNLVKSAQGFCFDLTALTIGQRYGLNGDQELATRAGSLDVIRVYRYEMTERASSGRLLGFARYAGSTNTEFDPIAGTCFLVKMWLEDAELIVDETQIGYGDYPAGDGERRPMASDSRYRYAVSEGQLVVHFQQLTFDVDPETLARTPSGDVFPPQISEEFGQPDKPARA